MHTSRDALELLYRNRVGCSNRKGLNDSHGQIGNVKQAEIVAWILVTLLAVVTFIAFRLLWLKAGGAVDRIYSLGNVGIIVEHLRSK